MPFAAISSGVSDIQDTSLPPTARWIETSPTSKMNVLVGLPVDLHPLRCYPRGTRANLSPRTSTFAGSQCLCHFREISRCARHTLNAGTTSMKPSVASCIRDDESLEDTTYLFICNGAVLFLLR